jgi:flagellar biosynthesis protein FlhF
VLSSIASLIPTNKLKLERNKKAKKVALVGPTGVGKTTCIAKLSVISKLIHNLDIGLISADTYRLGAIDQLRIFSEISNIELKVASEAGEMADIINKFRKKDLIFIDTAGRSQNNIQQLYETKEFLNAAQVDETYLVVSSTSSTKLLLDVLKKYKLFNYDSVIYTKIDEAVTFGSILNVAVKKNIPISFLSNGQVIPDDIIAADSEFIANMIYTGKINK